MPSSRFSTISWCGYFSESLKQNWRKIYNYLKDILNKWIDSIESSQYITLKKNTVNVDSRRISIKLLRAKFLSYNRQLKIINQSNNNLMMQNSENKEENSQKEVGFITPFQNMSLNHSMNESVFENALSASQFTCADLPEDDTNQKEAKPQGLLASGKLSTLLSSSSHSIPSLANSSNPMLPFEHIWIAQLCTWLHSRGLQHYGATFPNLFTSDIFCCSRNKFIRECGPIDGPHIYDAIQLLYWIHRNSFGHLWHQLSGFSFEDITSFSKKDLTSICGRNDGIRLYYALKVKLTIYCALENNENEHYTWKVISLRKVTVEELIKQLTAKFDLPQNNIHSTKLIETLGIHIVLDDDLLNRVKNNTEYLIQLTSARKPGMFELRFKPYCG
ncbi:uncharacterized protein LOC130665344 [Microplitis mediator]|uniref:uncharacterized protein LOC130665344 n=1 Tax=Microplitis mediator TaxID=375433 RepID=UPI00255234E4|nr:uncharacterized protein LOC130665344 [Microplitis mediator]